MALAEPIEELPEWIIIPPLIRYKITQYYHFYHQAVDIIPTLDNDWIIAVDSGEIIFAGWQDGYGYQIEIQHPNNFISTYSHLKSMDYKTGDKVKMGNKIGIIGSTGYSTGYHLHFEILFNGIKINPLNYLK